MGTSLVVHIPGLCAPDDGGPGLIPGQRTRRASLVAHVVTNLHPMRETQVQPLNKEDPLEKGKATHSSILAWRIPWTEEPGGLHPIGSQRLGYDE